MRRDRLISSQYYLTELKTAGKGGKLMLHKILKFSLRFS